MDYKINVIVYGLLFILEMFAWLTIMGKLTHIHKKIDVRFFFLLVAGVLLADIFVFQFQKTLARSVIMLVVYYVAYKYIYDCSWKTASICVFLTLVMMMGIDALMTTVVNGLMEIPIKYVYEHYTIFYLSNIALVYIYLASVLKFKWRLINLNKRIL